MLLKRLALAAVVALTGSMLVAAPSHADAGPYNDTRCWHYNGGLAPPPSVCLRVNYSERTNGLTGMVVHSLTIWIPDGQLGQFNPNAIQPCDNLRIWNDKGVVKWRRDSPPVNTWQQSCELSQATPSKSWPNLEINMPDTDSIHEGWTFDANMYHNPDRDDVHIGGDQDNTVDP